MTLSRPEILEKAREIAEKYRDDGYSLTLRQLYYQCVADGLIPNSDKSYKQLGDVIGDARLARQESPAHGSSFCYRSSPGTSCSRSFSDH